jgi:hypothetical protein
MECGLRRGLVMFAAVAVAGFAVHGQSPAQTTAAALVKPPVMQIRVLDRMTGAEKENSGLMHAGVWLQTGNQ